MELQPPAGVWPQRAGDQTVSRKMTWKSAEQLADSIPVRRHRARGGGGGGGETVRYEMRVSLKKICLGLIYE